MKMPWLLLSLLFNALLKMNLSIVIEDMHCIILIEMKKL